MSAAISGGWVEDNQGRRNLRFYQVTPGVKLTAGSDVWKIDGIIISDSASWIHWKPNDY